MASVPPASFQPTDLAALPELLAYTQQLDLTPQLHRPKRGLSTLAASILWLCLAWRGSGRPYHLCHLQEPFLAAIIGRPRLPTPQTLYRSLSYFSAKALREAVEAAYCAGLDHREGKIWVAIDTHQIPYWGRGKLTQFQKGWSGSHSRRLRGYRVLLAVDTDTGAIITFLLVRGKTRDGRLIALVARHLRQLLGSRLAGIVADCGFTSKRSIAALSQTGVPFILGFARSKPIRARLLALSPQQRRWLKDGGAVRLGVCPWDERLRLLALGARSPTDKRGPWVYVTSLRSAGPQWLATTYRQRWRAEQAIEEIKNGHDLDHLVSYRLHANRIAIGFRLLARNLAIGLQLEQAQGRPIHMREPRAFRATQVDGLGVFEHGPDAIVLHPVRARQDTRFDLPWTHCSVRLAA
jgi:hypothetical protein